MSVTTPTTGQKISDFSAGIVDADSYFIQARNGGTSKVSAPQIGQFSNLNLLFTGDGGLNTTAKTIVGAINEVNAAIDELDEKTGSDISVSSSDSTSVATAINGVKENIDNFKAYSIATVPTTSYVLRGEIKCYKRGACLMIKISGVTFATFTSRVTIGTLPTGFRPLTQATSHADFSTILFGADPDGRLWIETEASGKQLWANLTCISNIV